MNQVAKIQAGGVVKFEPAEARVNDAKADAVIALAKKLKDWPLLETAIEEKMGNQEEFVRWWRENISKNVGSGRGNKMGAERGLFSREDAEERTTIKHQQVSKWDRRLKDPDKYREFLFGTEYRAAMAEKSNVTATKWTGDPESYTPERYIEAAREVMGVINLDPASNEIAQKIVKADDWYGWVSNEDNGLTREWRGCVFLNPPYAFPAIRDFVEKLCNEFSDGRVTQAILLTNNNTDAKWWHASARYSAAVCFTAGRINFYKEDGSTTSPTNGQNFFYFGG